jgi:hypothetical protein
MSNPSLCKMCGVSLSKLGSAISPSLCVDCMDEIKLQKELADKGIPRTPAMPSPSGPIGPPGMPIIPSPHVPPGQAFIVSNATWQAFDTVSNDDVLAKYRAASGFTEEQVARSFEIERAANALTRITGSALTADDLQRAMDGFGKLSEEKTQEVLELATQRRAEQVREVRQRIFTLLRPVVEEDMPDTELMSLTHALMAQMAPLGGTDIESLYGVDAYGVSPKGTDEATG